MEKLIPPLLAKNIILRPISFKDVTEQYLNWLNDPLVNKYLEVRHTIQTLTNVGEFVASKINADNEHLFAICDRETSRHIGNIKLGPIDNIHKRADISLFIGDKDFWGKGLASQAITALSIFALTTLKLNKLMASCYQDNQASVKAFKHAGFLVEGSSPDYLLLNGKPHNLIWMGLSVRQFQRQK